MVIDRRWHGMANVSDKPTRSWRAVLSTKCVQWFSWCTSSCCCYCSHAVPCDMTMSWGKCYNYEHMLAGVYATFNTLYVCTQDDCTFNASALSSFNIFSHPSHIHDTSPCAQSHTLFLHVADMPSMTFLFVIDHQECMLSEVHFNYY